MNEPLFWTIAAALFLCALGLLYWGLWGDRARGRLRCPKCWFQMADQMAKAFKDDEFKCPQCDHDARTEKRLRKSRKRWGLILTSCVLLMPHAYGLYVFAAWIPDRALVLKLHEHKATYSLNSNRPVWSQKVVPKRLQILYDRPGNLNFPGDLGFYPLHLAALTGDLDFARLLISYGAIPDPRTSTSRGYVAVHRPLHFAAEFGHTNIVRLLLKQGADINARGGPENRPQTWMTPLGLALTNKENSSTVKLLINSGAQVNGVSSPSALSKAARYYSPPIVKLLLARGAQFNDKGFDGKLIGTDQWSKLDGLAYFAISGDNDAVLEFAISSGADPGIHYHEYTGLHVAARSGNIQLARMLIEKQVQVNVRDPLGATPLTKALEKKDTTMIALLQEHGGTE